MWPHHDACSLYVLFFSIIIFQLVALNDRTNSLPNPAGHPEPVHQILFGLVKIILFHVQRAEEELLALAIFAIQ